jgi:SAM-dependent methyltransferase
MSTAISDLIYDVGLLDGTDTAYYLFWGYRVVAVDVNPTMIEAARVRFANEIASQASDPGKRNIGDVRQCDILDFREAAMELF